MRPHTNKMLLCCVAVVWTTVVHSAIAETIFVDAGRGNDENPGTFERPVGSVERAFDLVNATKGAGPTTIRIAPGIYALAESVELGGARQYTDKERLVVEATVLPDDPRWRPVMMPTILSVEDPRTHHDRTELTATYGMKIGTSHVTIRGLRFLGNPLLQNWHCCIARTRDDLDDLVVTQCVFAGDVDVADIYCAVIAAGDGFVVDHCIFRNCHACAVFWDGPQVITGRNCAMRYCIVDSARIAGVWTCQTAEDFEFHHNIVTGSEYFWMRKRVANPRRYRIHDCVVSDNKNYSGYGVESGPTGLTGPEVVYDETNVIKKGPVLIEKNSRERNYQHVVAGTPGGGLGAGLFSQ